MHIKPSIRNITAVLLLFSPGLFQSCTIIRAVSFGTKVVKVKVKEEEFNPIVLSFRMTGNSVIVKIPFTTGNTTASADLMVDTGAPTFISKKLADSLGLKTYPVKGAMFRTPGGDSSDAKTKYYFIDNVIFKAGNNEITKKHLLVRSLPNDFRRCSGVDGLLGSDILSRFNVSFDFTKKEMTLYPKSSEPADLKEYNTIIPFKPRLFGHNPMVKLGVLDTVYTFVWDMGFSGEMYIQYPADSRKEFDHFIKIHPNHVDVETFGAVSDVNGRVKYKGERYYLPVDSIRMKKNSISISHDYANCVYNERLDELRANIGIRFMQDYKVFISWKDRKIYLQRDTISHTPAKVLLAAAYYDAADSSVVADAVNKDSKYYRAGLRAGMHITYINGQSINDFIRAPGFDPCNIDAKLSEAIVKAAALTVQEGGQNKLIKLTE